MKYETFDQCVEIALCGNTSEQNKRMEEEIVLFRKRGWEEYIVLAVNILNELERQDCCLCVPSRSVLDSCLVWKLTGRKWYGKDPFMSEHGKEILFNDALRLELHTGSVSPDNRDYVKSATVLKECLVNSGLTYKEHVTEEDIKYTSGCGVGTVVVSKGPIPESDMSVILNERKESTAREAEILRKYFIIKCSYHWGL